MTVIAATEAKNKFGELLEAIHREPVEISKKGRAVAVVLSIEDYKDMTQKLAQLERPTDFSWLDTWRKNAKRHPNTKPMDKADYYKHLDEKYGS